MRMVMIAVARACLASNLGRDSRHRGCSRLVAVTAEALKRVCLIGSNQGRFELILIGARCLAGSSDLEKLSLALFLEIE